MGSETVTARLADWTAGRAKTQVDLGNGPKPRLCPGHGAARPRPVGVGGIPRLGGGFQL